MAEPKKKYKDTFEKWIAAGEVEGKLAIIQSLAMQGLTMEEIGKEMGISRRSMYNMQKEHPILKKTIEKGRLNVVALCQNKLMENVMNGDTSAIIYALKVYGGDFFNDRKNNITEAKLSQNNVHIYLPATDNATNSKETTIESCTHPLLEIPKTNKKRKAAK